MRSKLKHYLNNHNWQSSVPDVRHLLTTNAVLDLRLSFKDEIVSSLSASGHFIPERINELAKWFIEAPTAEELIQAGDPVGYEIKGVLHLGAGIIIGSKFADCIAPGHGGPAVRHAEALFTNMQKRFRCLLLRAAAAQIPSGERIPECRIAVDGRTACSEIWDASNESHALSELPTLPLPDCSAKTCNCGLDWLQFTFE